MLEDILERTMDAANEFIERPSFKRLTSVSISSLFSASWEYRNSDSGNWRTRMSRILDVLAEYSIGLLITIDEIDPNLEELIAKIAKWRFSWRVCPSMFRRFCRTSPFLF